MAPWLDDGGEATQWRAKVRPAGVPRGTRRRRDNRRMGLTLRDALREERGALEELPPRASLHEPTYRQQLLAHPDAIELPVERIDAGFVRVAELKGATAGFA